MSSARRVLPLPAGVGKPSRLERLQNASRRLTAFHLVTGFFFLMLMITMGISIRFIMRDYVGSTPPREFGLASSHDTIGANGRPAQGHGHSEGPGHRHAGTFSRPIPGYRRPQQPQSQPQEEEEAAGSARARTQLPRGEDEETGVRPRSRSRPGRPVVVAEEREAAETETEMDDRLDPGLIQKREAVKNAMKHAWKGYVTHCFGQDELRPISGSCGNWLSLGLTAVDSLSTLWIMGLKDEFKQGRDWVESSLGPLITRGRHVSLFETVIRILGGLESAYDLSGDRVFLDRARQLADRMLPGFSTRTGLPRAEIDLSSGRSNSAGWTGGASLLAEVGTIQLEFTFLTDRLKELGEKNVDVYANTAQKIIDVLDGMRKPHGGLYPIYINPDSGQFTNQKITVGAMGDSFYEYLLKMWMFKGSKPDCQYRRMYRESANAILDNLLHQTPNGLWYLADLDGHMKQHKMDHLACFAAGMFALGVEARAVEGEEAERHLQAGKDLTRTCYEMYKLTPSGLSPEYVTFNPNMAVGEPANHLRPEAVEAIFVLWRITKDPMYRDWGWEIFEAFERHTRVPRGYSGLGSVYSPATSKDDKQESFFMAETLKYLYLLFSPDNVIPLDKWVFNTECHPLAIKK